MGVEPGETQVTRILRIVLGTVVDLAGVFVAVWSARRRIARRVRRPKAKEHSPKSRRVASAIGPAGDFAIENCLHCGRTAADVRALGCGGTNRKGQCLARTL